MLDSQVAAVTAALKAHPETSNREIARRCGVDEKSVRRLRAKLAAQEAAAPTSAPQSQETKSAPAQLTQEAQIKKEEAIMSNQKPSAVAVQATIPPEPQAEAPTFKRSEMPSGYLTREERVDYALVEIGPRSRNLNDDPERTGGFYEADYRHPGINGNSQAHVIDGRVVKVFKTPRVRQALHDGRLVESFLPETTGLTNVSDCVDEAKFDVNQALVREQVDNERLRQRVSDLEARLDAQAVPAAK